MERETLPRYRVICTQLSLPHEPCVPTYGVEMVVGERVERFPDVSTEETAVRRLVALLQEQRVEACHFREVVEDYLVYLSLP